MPGALTLNDRLAERSAPIAQPEADKPDFLEGISSAFRVARADTSGYVQGAQVDAYSPLIQSLQDMGYKPENFVNIGSGTVSPEAVWKAVTRERAKGHFGNLPETMEEFETGWRQRERQRIERDSATAQQAGFIPSLIGGVGGAMTDPINLYALPFGGFGKTLTTRLFTEALANMAVETVLIPVAQGNRKQLGREAMTGNEMLTNVVFAGLGAAALRGAGEGVVHHWDAIKATPRAAQERVWSAILQRNPKLAKKVGQEVNWDALDPHLADIAEMMVGRDAMTPEQRAAVDGARQQGQFARANPYVGDAAGRTAHLDGMALAMKRIMDGAPAIPVPLSPRPGRAGLADSTAVASRTVAGDAFSTLKRRIGVVESGGSDTAKNPRSSATGRYQFIGSTWLRLYRNRYGQNGLSDGQILSKRTDGRLQEVLMDDLLQTNADALEAAGITVDAGNLYLAHFAGSGGARALHRANPGSSARSVLGDAVVNANPFLDRMTAREVIDWAAGKMGGGGERAMPARAEEGSATDAIEEELAALRSEREALLEDAGLAPRGEGTPDSPLQTEEIAEDIPTVRADLLPENPMDEAVRDAMPALRDLVGDRSRSINAIDDIASELGLEPDQVRRGLSDLAQRGEIVLNVPRGTRQRIRAANGRFRNESDAELLARREGVWDGNFMRRPPAPVRGTNTLAEWISEQGGLKDDGGDLAAMGGGEWHKAKPFRRSLLARDGDGIAADEALDRAIEQGFFPELAGRPQDTYADLHDVRLLFDALGEELAGKPRTRGDILEGERAGERFDSDHPDYEPIHSFVADELETLGFDRAAVPAEWIDELAAEVFRRPNGMSDEDAVFYGLHAMRERNAADAFAETGELDYEPIGYDEFSSILDEAGYRAAAEDSARRAADAEPAGEGGLRGDGAGESAGAPEGLERGPLDSSRYDSFDDPQGEAAKAQKDSLAHDARAELDDATRRYQQQFDSPTTSEEAADLLGPAKDDPERADWMEGWELGRRGADSPPDGTPLNDGWTVGNATFQRQGPPATDAGAPSLARGAQTDPAVALRQVQEARLRAEAPLRGENRTGAAQDGTMGLGLFDAANEPGFRFDTEGEAQGLPELLADLDADEAELGAIRNCLL